MQRLSSGSMGGCRQLATRDNGSLRDNELSPIVGGGWLMESDGEDSVLLGELSL
jgi:hypothetical protein